MVKKGFSETSSNLQLLAIYLLVEYPKEDQIAHQWETISVVPTILTNQWHQPIGTGSLEEEEVVGLSEGVDNG